MQGRFSRAIRAVRRAIFGKGDGEVSVRQNRTLIAADLVLKGSMRSTGDVYLLGRVDGDIECDRIFLSGTGAVDGSVRARQQIFIDS
jgi:cytoskeletal protein CcmA (bactofilin family)